MCFLVGAHKYPFGSCGVVGPSPRAKLAVGGLAATMNYVSHKKKWLSFMALVGLSLVYAANGSGGPLLSLLSHDWRHALHCGTVLHRVVNVSGCALLLSSNYMGHRHSCKDANCNHLH